MPHGSRLNAQGTKQYSACMMDDMLVEIDTRTLKVARHFIVTKNQENGLPGPPGPRMSPEIHTVHGTLDMDLSRRSPATIGARRRGPSLRRTVIDLCRLQRFE